MKYLRYFFAFEPILFILGIMSFFVDVGYKSSLMNGVLNVGSLACFFLTFTASLLLEVWPAKTLAIARWVVYLSLGIPSIILLLIYYGFIASIHAVAAVFIVVIGSVLFFILVGRVGG